MVDAADKRFAGAIPEMYDRLLVPLIFAPYADDLAARLRLRAPGRVLELAAGTGAATRALAAQLPPSTEIVATDLNPAMLQHARAVGTARPVTWQQADALALPFPDGTFDAVVCQFGAMFFPDKSRGFAEARRVLRPGGVLLFSTWDRIEENAFAETVTAVLVARFPERPPRFLARTPHGYHDPAVIRRDLAAGGFAASPEVTTLAARSRAATAEVPAIAYCQGTPLRNELEACSATGVEEGTALAARAIRDRFGPGPVDGKIQAHVMRVER